MTLNEIYRRRDEDLIIDFLFNNKFEIFIKYTPEEQNKHKITLIFEEEDVADQYITIFNFRISSSSYLSSLNFATNIESGRAMLKDFETEDDIEGERYFSFALCLTIKDFIEKYVDSEIKKANLITNKEEKVVILEKMNKIIKITNYFFNE